MRRSLFLAALLAGCASAPQPAAAPDFDLPTEDGQRVHAADLWGSKPLLLVFMTSW